MLCKRNNKIKIIIIKFNNFIALFSLVVVVDEMLEQNSMDVDYLYSIVTVVELVKDQLVDEYQ